GPKYRPTPFLTPVMAGAIAAFVVTGLALAHGQGGTGTNTAIATGGGPIPVPRARPESTAPPAPTFAAVPAELSLFSQLSAATEAALSETILPASAEPLQASLPAIDAPIPRAR